MEHRFGFDLRSNGVVMRVFISIVAAAAMALGWISTHEHDYPLGVTMFAVALTFYVIAIVAEQRNMGNRALDALCVVIATFGLASAMFLLRYEEAVKRAAGQ